MSFLVPAALWGLFGAALPILVHLLSVRRTQKIDFSTVRFIKSLEHSTIRKLKLRQWILLAMRTLAVALLVLAFARPVKVGYFPPWAAGQQTSKLVFLVDNSASMSARFEGESLLERSKKTLLRIVKGMEGRVWVDIYQTTPLLKRFSGDPSAVTDLERNLSLIRHTQGRDDLWNAIPTVLRDAAEETGITSAPANWEFYVFSDFPSPLPDDWRPVASDAGDPLPPWRYYLFPQPEVENNLAVVSTEVTSQLRLPDQLVTILARVENQGSEPQENVPIQLYFEDDRVGQMVADFDPYEGKDFVFQAFPNRAGLVHGFLKIPEDNYGLDDQRYFPLSVPVGIRCKVVGPSRDDLAFVDIALRSINDEREFLKVETVPTYDVTTLSLDGVDVVVLVDPPDFKPALVDEIEKFVREGGGLIAFLGNNYEKWNDSVSVAKLGFPRVTGVIRLGGESFHQVVGIDGNHPLFQGFPVDDLSEEMPQVFSHVRLFPDKTVDELLALSDGDPFLVEMGHSGSKMLFFTSLPDLRWSDFPVRGIFVPLLHRILVYLAAPDEGRGSVEVGNKVEIPLGRDVMSADLRLVKPSGVPVFLVPDYRQEVVVIDEVDEAGIYELFSEDRSVSSFVANPSSLEAPDNRVDTGRLDKIFSSGQSRIIDYDQDAVRLVQEARRGTDLWPLFLVGVLGVVMAETWVGRVRRGEKG
ncbi:MAG: BatA and WFA domain-containing protein [Fidelibacterota bacterium]